MNSYTIERLCTTIEKSIDKICHTAIAIINVKHHQQAKMRGDLHYVYCRPGQENCLKHVEEF